MEENKEEVIETKVEEKKDRKGLAIASMVLGIIALVLFCIWYISIPCGILSIIFGILAIKSTRKGMAIAGLVTGSIGFALTILIFVAIFVFGFTAAFVDGLDSLDTKYNNSYHHYNYDFNDYE